MFNERNPIAFAEPHPHPEVGKLLLLLLRE